VIGNFTPLPLYAREKNPRYPLSGSLGRPLQRVWTRWQRVKIRASAGYKPRSSSS